MDRVEQLRLLVEEFERMGMVRECVACVPSFPVNSLLPAFIQGLYQTLTTLYRWRDEKKLTTILTYIQDHCDMTRGRVTMNDVNQAIDLTITLIKKRHPEVVAGVLWNRMVNEQL